MLAITTLVVIGAHRLVFLGATQFFFLALGSYSRRYRLSGWSRGSHFRSRSNGRQGGSILLLARFGLGLFAGLFLGLQAGGLFGCTLLFQLL